MKKLSAIFKTGLLLALLTALLMGIGYYFYGPDSTWSFLTISAIMNFLIYFFSDKIALRMAGAQELSESQAPEIFADVNEIAQKMNIPSPKIYVSDNQQPNAFATGRNPRNSSILVTRGLVNTLNRDELKGVLAHELAHIRNFDVLIATVAATVAGAVSAISRSFLYFGGSSDRRRRSGIVEIAALLLAPLAALIIQLAVSRAREYSADRAAAEFTKRPQDLASALEKIHTSVKQIPMDVNPSISSLFIANPFGKGGLTELFSTHPRIEKRIKRLEEIEFGGQI